MYNMQTYMIKKIQGNTHNIKTMVTLGTRLDGLSFSVTYFWRVEVQDQGAIRLASGEGCCLHVSTDGLYNVLTRRKTSLVGVILPLSLSGVFCF